MFVSLDHHENLIDNHGRTETAAIRLSPAECHPPQTCTPTVRFTMIGGPTAVTKNVNEINTGEI
jgi:hypothetical protein